ncbi:MAG: hypothetical protein Q8L90_15965 [Bacteroidota bacterium]|nr:hypothetical protein [Bacteroidota bacterium]
MEEFEVKPQWKLSEDYNDKGSSIDGKIVVKVIAKRIRESEYCSWQIIVLDSEKNAKEYFNKNKKGTGTAKNTQCFMTSEHMLKQALNEKYIQIEMEWLAKKTVSTYWCILSPK